MLSDISYSQGFFKGVLAISCSNDDSTSRGVTHACSCEDNHILIIIPIHSVEKLNNSMMIGNKIIEQTAILEEKATIRDISTKRRKKAFKIHALTSLNQQSLSGRNQWRLVSTCLEFY